MGQDISRPRNRAEFPNVLLFVHLIRSDDVVAELVIGIDQGWNDGIRSHWACGSRRTSICGGDVVGVLDPGDRARESRIGIAVETVGVRSRHRQWRGIDGQLAIV